jgi:hypothetical protein
VVEEAETGETVTEVTVEGAVTLTVAEPDFVLSALLVAVTVSVPACAGAVYSPAEVMVPKAAFQVTEVLEVVPLTVAVNGSVPLVVEEAEAGETVTEVTVGGELTVTVAEPDFVLSALLVAVTVSVPACAGAVYNPAEVTVPKVAFQATEVSEAVPLTVAVNESVPLVGEAAVAGETVTEVTVGLEVDVVPRSSTTTALELALVIKERLPVTLPELAATKLTVKD